MGASDTTIRVIRGHAPDGRSSSRGAARFAKGRMCAEDGCPTRLSVYNPAGRCWQHEIPHTAFVRAGRRRASVDEGPGVIGLPELLRLLG
jgi:hypothetical protein